MGIMRLIFTILFSLSICHSQVSDADISPLEVEQGHRQVVSEYFGYTTGKAMLEELKAKGFSPKDFDSNIMLAAFEAALKEEKALDLELFTVGMNLMNAKLVEREFLIANENAKENVKWLEENLKGDHIKSTESGLQYEIVSEGGGAVKKFKEDDGSQNTFIVQYRGTNLEGQVFDQTPDGKSVSIAYSNLKGVEEALQLMPVGSHWKIYLKPELAFGKSRFKSAVKPNSIVIVDLKLISVNTAK